MPIKLVFVIYADKISIRIKPGKIENKPEKFPVFPLRADFMPIKEARSLDCQYITEAIESPYLECFYFAINPSILVFGYYLWASFCCFNNPMLLFRQKHYA